MPKSDLKQTLTMMEPRTKAARLRELMPIIVERIASGVRISEILKTLNEGGMEITEGTLKNYLYRYRKKKKGATEQSKTSEPEENVSYDTETKETKEPVSIQELDRLMKPDPAAQAQELAKYEQLAKRRRRSQKP